MRIDITSVRLTDDIVIGINWSRLEHGHGIVQLKG